MAFDRLHAILRHARRRAGRHAADRLTDAQLLDRHLAGHDETAFAALVRRHGRLVATACRRVLSDEADVEDAFQATFLILLRKAGSIRRQQSLACWLYRVAGRVAAEARAAAIRRQRLERPAGGRGSRRAEQPGSAGASPSRADGSWREVCEVLHAELDRLPESLRLPLILCYLDGKTRDEAARQLGWPLSTLRGRLERGRVRLRKRLAARGVELSATLLATAAANRADAVGPALVRSAVRLVCGASPTAAVSTLATAATRVAVGGPAALAIALAVVAGLSAALTVVGKGPPKAKPLAALPPSESPPAKPQAASPEDMIAYSGRVVGPDGKPVAGAKVYKATWWGYHFEPFTATESATTGPDGHFAFATPKGRFEESVIVAAAAPNLGLGWVGLLKEAPRTDLTLQMVTDDVPITGQIIDLEGKPVPGATVRVLQVMASPKHDLGPWLKAAMDKNSPVRDRDSRTEQDFLTDYTTAPSFSATTDAAGRFKLTGIGRERLVFVELAGPTIVSEHLRILTRPHARFDVPDIEANAMMGHPQIDSVYYGADFRHAAAPTRPIVGVVRDKDTKRPLAGVTVRSDKLANNPIHGRHFIQTKTNADGRYRLVGMPKGAGNKIQLVPGDDLPYAAPTVDVPDSFGLDPVTVDVELKRAVWIEGRLTDQVTGKPIAGHVTYAVRYANPNARDYPAFWGGMRYGKPTNDDGTFRLVGLPGPGQLLVFQHDGYLEIPERDDEDGLHEAFGPMIAGNFAAVARINPPKGTESIKRDLTLVPGWTFTGTVVGPDGKPMAGTKEIGLYGKREEVIRGAEFTVRDYNPRRPRPVFFRDLEKGLVGVVHPPEKNGGTVTVRMEPGGTVIGRVVDKDGKPRAGLEMRVSYRPKREPHWDENSLDETITSDRDGRFRFTALPLDFIYYLNADYSDIRIGSGLRAGETKDLGDVRFKP